MNIDELIKELQKVKKEHGNIEVAVQFRDDGGYYYGIDEELVLDVEEFNYRDENGNKQVRKTLVL